MTITLRAPAWDDAEAVSDLFNRHSSALYGVPDSTPADVERFWRLPRIELSRDVVLAVDGGEVVGYGDLYAEGERGEKIWLDVRGEGAREILGALEERARERAARNPAFIRAETASGDAALKEVLGAAGYRLVRHSFRMVIDLDGDVSRPLVPRGIRIRPFEREGDERRVYDVQQETFADMWEYEAQPLDEWRIWMFDEEHDPSLWWLAEDGEETAGIALCRAHQPGEPEMGFVNVLGVRRPWRRRGLGCALLQTAFAEFARRGRKRVGLGVDAESETGAVALYERVGMRVARRSETWEKAP